MFKRRYRRILNFFAGILIRLAFWDIFLPKVGFKAFSEKKRIDRVVEAAKRYRSLAIEMGGVMIKVGQFLSVRVDILPTQVTDVLSDLQDQVPQEDFQRIRELAERELGQRLEDCFSVFEEEPLASASLGQVHRAVLKPADSLQNGEDSLITNVVVKVQRPDIETIIDVDLSAFRIVTRWLRRYKPIRERVDLPTLMEEFSTILRQEIDYLNEGENAERFWEIYRSKPGIRVPRVIWARTTKRVLTLEDVYAIKITNYSQIKEAGVDLDQVALRLFASYMEQIFEEGFFHADPHPGNLFVILPDKSPTGAWQLAYVDFGMAGEVPSYAMDGLREMVIAVGTQDPKRLVQAYEKLGFLLPGADLELIEKAEAKVFARFWGKNMSELQGLDPRELMSFAEEFKDLMYEMPFQIPQELLLLGRTVAILSGMCSGLSPGFNVWQSIRPYAEDLMRSEVTDNWQVWWEEIQVILRLLLSLPKRLDGVLDQMERGKVQVQAPRLEKHLESIEKNLRGLTGAVLFAALFIGGMQLLLAGYSLPGYLLLGAGFLVFLIVLLR